MSAIVGSVSIKVRPDTGGFREKVERDLRRLRDVKIKVRADDEGLGRRLDQLSKQVRESTVKLRLDDRNLRKEMVEKFGENVVEFEGDFDKLKRQAKEEVSNLQAKIEFQEDFDTFGLSAKASAAAKLASRFKVWFRADLDTKTAMVKAGLLSASLRDAFRQSNYKFSADSLSLQGAIRDTGILNADFKGMRRSLKLLKADFIDLGYLARNVRLSELATGASLARYALSGAKSSLKGLVSAATSGLTPMRAFMNSLRGFASIANVFGAAMALAAGTSLVFKGAIVGVSAVVGYVTDAVKQLSRVGLLIPGLLGGAGMIGATLFAGFRGLGSALGAAVDTSADLESKLTGLAPSAAEFARALRSVTPAWKELSKNVQGRVFEGLGDELGRISERQLPTISRGMERLAVSTNGFFKDFAGFAGSARTSTALANGFASTSRIMDSMSDSVGNLLYGLQDIGVIGLRSVAEMSRSWAPTMERFAEWTNSVGGQITIQKWIDDSIQGFKDLGGTVGNLYTSLREVGNAFGIDFDSSALSDFRHKTEEFKKWLGSADDANSRIAGFAESTKRFADPWIEFFSGAWTDLKPAAKAALPMLESISDSVSENLGKAVEWVAPKLEKFFNFLSDNKWAADLVSGLLLFRLALAALKIPRAFLAPFVSLVGGVAGLVRNLAAFRKGGGFGSLFGKRPKDGGPNGLASVQKENKAKIKEQKKQAKRELKEQKKQAKKAAKVDSGGGFFSFGRDKSTKKTPGFLSKVSSGVKGLGAKAKPAIKPVNAVSGALGKLGKAGKGVGKIGKVAGGGLKLLGKGFVRLIPGVGTVLNLVTGFSLLKSLFPNLIPTIVNGVKSLPSLFSKIGPMIGTAFSGIGGWFKGVGGKMVDGLKSGASTAWSNFTGWLGTLGSTIGTSLSGAGTWLVTTGTSLINGLKTGIITGWQGVVSWFSTLGSTIGTGLSGAGTWLVTTGSTMMNGLLNGIVLGWTSVTGWFAGIGARIMGFFAGAGSWLVSSGSRLISGLGNGARSAWGSVYGAISSIKGNISGFFASAGSWLIGAGTSLITGFSNAIRGAVGTATAAAGSVKSAVIGFFQGAASWAVSAGSALVSGFADGIRGAISSAVSAAESVVGAVRARFPFSPAKKGPLSGKGYTTHSGKALVKDFSKGMLSEQSAAAKAASGVAADVKKAFTFDSGVFKRHHKAKIDAELMGTPDYSSIDKSWRKYYLEGAKEILTERLKNVVRGSDLAGSMRAAALRMVKEGRKAFGDHPIFAQVEANVNSKHFGWAVEKAIEDSNIAAIPIEFAVTNLEQLKSDLGMGDGVVSRAIDAALDFDPNNTDKRAYKQSGPATEVHYHVEDMNEAIRLEKLRERKAMMKMRR